MNVRRKYQKLPVSLVWWLCRVIAYADPQPIQQALQAGQHILLGNLLIVSPAPPEGLLPQDNAAVRCACQDDVLCLVLHQPCINSCFAQALWLLAHFLLVNWQQLFCTKLLIDCFLCTLQHVSKIQSKAKQHCSACFTCPRSFYLGAKMPSTAEYFVSRAHQRTVSSVQSPASAGFCKNKGHHHQKCQGRGI